jgi:hypothetical protein
VYGISRIDAGPQAIALSFGAGADSDFINRAVASSNGALSWRNKRLIWKRSSKMADKRLADSEKILKYLAKVELG